MAERLQEEGVVHVRFEGCSRDLALSDLDVGVLASDEEIKSALAAHLHVPVGRLRDHVIDRHQTGNLTLRPEAVFG